MAAELVLASIDQTPTTADVTTLELLLRRIRGEFRDMPGLKLTPAQASRLFGVEPTLCERLFMALVEGRHLLQGPDGRFRRPDPV